MNSLKNKFFWLGLFIAMMSFFWIERELSHSNRQDAGNHPAQQEEFKITRSVSQIPQQDIHQNAPSTQKTSPQSGKDKEISTPPSLKQYSDEAKANPHDTPKSLTTYATYISQRWKDSEGDAQKTEKFFAEIAACSKTNQTPVAVRSFCADTARMLTEKNPDLLNDLWFDLYQQLDSETKKLIQPLRTK